MSAGAESVFSLSVLIAMYALKKDKGRHYDNVMLVSYLISMVTLSVGVWDQPEKALIFLIWIPGWWAAIHFFTFLKKFLFYILSGALLATTFYAMFKIPSSVNFFASTEYRVQFAISLVLCLLWMSFFLVSRIRMQEQLLKNLEDEKESVMMLNRIISHDLSNALNITISSLDIIRSKPEKTVAYLDKATRASKKMSDMIKVTREINLAGTHKGQPSLDGAHCEIKDVVTEVISFFEEPIKAKNISIVLQINPPIKQVIVAGDHTIVGHNILANLLSNAIKFTNFGGTITIGIETTDSLVKLSVHDNGIGIPNNLVPLLFDLNAQTSRAGTAGEHGTGFGLPIVKKLVEKLGGTIMVQSIESKGTTFVVTIPRKLALSGLELVS